jgi:hypothetical protein
MLKSLDPSTEPTIVIENTHRKARAGSSCLNSLVVTFANISAAAAAAAAGIAGSVAEQLLPGQAARSVRATLFQLS